MPRGLLTFWALPRYWAAMSSTSWLFLSGVAFCATASFFFALAESSLFALGRWRARRLADQPHGELVMRLLEQPAELLATLSLGNTLANAGIVALSLWPAVHGQFPLAATLAGLFVLVLLGCEVLPKTLGVRAPERWALRVARPVAWVQGGTGWLRALVQGLNRRLMGTVLAHPTAAEGPSLNDEEYRELVELAFQQGALRQREKEIILEIIHLDRKAARDVMRPRSRMAAISDELSIEEMMVEARRHQRRRLAIYDETPDTIVGILDTQKLLLNPDGDLADAIDFPSFVPESMNCLQLLKSLQRQQRGLAIVLDEFGGVAGVVRVEDILEEVVGEIRDEGEAAGFIIEKLAEGRWRVNGLMAIEDFRREYPDLPEISGVDTMGGLLVRQLEMVPPAGRAASFAGLRLTAAVVDERRVKELLVEKPRKHDRGRAPARPV